VSGLDLVGRAGLADAAMDVARQVRRRVRPRLADLRRHRHAALLLVRAKHSKLAMSLIGPEHHLMPYNRMTVSGAKTNIDRPLLTDLDYEHTP